MIPFGATVDRPDHDYTDNVTLRVFQLADGAGVTTRIPTLDGPTAIFTTTRAGSQVRVEAANTARGWKVHLVGIEHATADSGSVTQDLLGVLIGPEISTVTRHVARRLT